MKRKIKAERIIRKRIVLPQADGCNSGGIVINGKAKIKKTPIRYLFFICLSF